MLKILSFFKKKTKKFDSKTPALSKLKFNIKKDSVDPRDFPLKSALLSDEKLPDYIDLRNYCTPVKNQKYIGSCGPHAIGASWEIQKNIIENQMGPTSPWDISELYIYYNARDIMGTIGQDSGVTLRELCKAVRDNGCSLELLWPYLPDKYNDKPGTMAYFLKNITNIEWFYRVVTIEDVHLALSKKIPIVIGMVIFENFYSAEKGKIYSEISGRQLGGHAMTIVGIDNKNKKVLLRNSWGSDWCDNGYVWISYDMFNKYVFDAWVPMISNDYNELSKKSDKIIYEE